MNAFLEKIHAQKITAACRRLDNAENVIALKNLAHEAGMSPYHFHRLFKAMTGVTPREYAAARQARQIHGELRKPQSITSAIYEAGFNSSSRFYEKSTALLGMTPTRYRGGGRQEEIRFAVGESSLGSILVAATTAGICAVFLGDKPDKLIHDLRKRFPQANLLGAEKKFERWVALVVGLVEDPRRGLKLPLDVRGTAFQQKVWQALRKIPVGKTATYTEIARKIGYPQAVRGVARACAANKIAVAIPCHRVVRKGGDLSGYRWGVERKRALLLKENKSGAEFPQRRSVKE